MTSKGRLTHPAVAPIVAAVLAMAAFVFPGTATACEQVCIARTDFEVLLREARHVFVGRVTDHSGRMSVIRAWKGGRREFVLVNAGGGASCGMSVSYGRVYLAFIGDPSEGLDTCSPVAEVWTWWAKQGITRLDRLRGFPPLSLPPEDLRAPGR